ncbi:MAG: OmpA family protein [Acetobacteraceae bacterium]
MKLRSALVAATILALPAAANAQAVRGIYVGAGAGINLMQQQTVDSVPGSTTSGKFGSTVGPAAVLSLGYGFGNGLRAEIEGSYRYNSLNSASGFSNITTGGAKEQKYGAMFNVLYDIAGLGWPVQPYVGVGAGYQWVMLQNAYGSSSLGTVTIGDSTEGAFAYQAMIGASMPIRAVPGLALTAEYRFMGLVGDREYSALSVPTVGAPVTGNAKFSDNYNHSILLGVRYNFGQTPPPVAPAAAPAPAVQPARSYLVFFDWDKATLTDRARQIIKEAADNSTRVQYTRIEVNGYTDTSGTPKYNQGLSVRRAQAVAAELVKNGVPRNAITATGFGDTKLLVPTGPNVREPQNRRVEIIIR